MFGDKSRARHSCLLLTKLLNEESKRYGIFSVYLWLNLNWTDKAIIILINYRFYGLLLTGCKTFTLSSRNLCWVTKHTVTASDISNVWFHVDSMLSRPWVVWVQSCHCSYDCLLYYLRESMKLSIWKSSTTYAIVAYTDPPNYHTRRIADRRLSTLDFMSFGVLIWNVNRNYQGKGQT